MGLNRPGRGLVVDALLILVLAVVAGAINTMVGGGTYIMLPVLVLFLGLDPKIANATNRFAVSFQAAAGATTLFRSGAGKLRTALLLALIALAGGAVGAYINHLLDPERFRSWMGWLFLLGVGLMFLPKRSPQASAQGPKRFPWLGYLGTFVLGIYGGFLGAGVGVLILLFLPRLLDMDLVPMVAVKVVMVCTFSAAASVVYLWYGYVDFRTAVPLIGGYVLGAVLGARLTLRGGDQWVRRLVAAVAIVLAVLLILGIGPA